MKKAREYGAHKSYTFANLQAKCIIVIYACIEFSFQSQTPT